MKRNAPSARMGDFSLLASRLLSALAQAIVLVILARQTSISAFGQYGIALAVGAVAIGVLGLGLPTRVLLSGLPEEKGSRSAVWLSSFVLGGLVVPVTVVASVGIVGSNSTAIWAGAVFSGAELAGNLHQNSLFGQKAMRRAEAVLVLRRALPLLAVSLSYFVASADTYLAAAVGSSLSWVTTCLIAGEGFTGRRQIPSEIASSRHYWLTNIGAMAQQLDVAIVGGVAGPAASAGFSAAFRLASPIHIVTGLITARLGPEVRLGGSSKTRRRYFSFGVWYALLVVLASPIIAFLAPLLLGADYSSFYWVFVALFANSGVSVLNQVLTVRLFALGLKKAQVAIATIGSTVLGLLIVWIGAMTHLLWVSALGTLSIQVVLFAALATMGRISRID